MNRRDPLAEHALGEGFWIGSRSRRRRRVMICVASITAIGAVLFPRTMPRLVWNASPSAPIGCYWVEAAGPLRVGDMVLAVPPEWAGRLADERGYLPFGVPLVKRIAAVDGDTVCSGGGIRIDGRVVAQQLQADRKGRPMPAWSGCRNLGPDEVFLLMESVQDSFDGRYFGPTERSEIIGRLVPLWTR
jgi:conjugative transfer signal peptidase TraF